MLEEDALAERVRLLRLLVEDEGEETAGLLAEQVLRVANLPAELRSSIFRAIRRAPPPDLAALGRRAAAAADPHVRGAGFRMLALAGDPLLREHLLGPAPAMETHRRLRRRYLALALASYEREDAALAAEGAARVARWNEEEERWRTWYTGGKGFSLAAPARPCLGSEDLFERLAWLAWLSRHEPLDYGAQFAREWIMVGQHVDYCDRSKNYLWGLAEKAGPEQVARIEQQVRDMNHFRHLWQEMAAATRPVIDALVRDRPSVATEGLAQAHFRAEAMACIDLLGAYRPQETRDILDTLCSSEQPLLAAWAQARLEGE
jgi:hypothetical protein